MYDVTNIGKILENDAYYLKILKNNLLSNGWCFVKFGDYFNEKMLFHAKNIKQFFNKEENIKNNYSYSHNIGYYQNNFKQHFKIMTGDYNLPNLQEQKNDTSIKSMIFISKLMDKLMKTLFINTKNSVFELQNDDLQYLSVNNNQTIGLLDFVEYKNNTEREYFVAEHVDPGLFSLNIYCDQKGMEFYDYTTKKWIEMPLGYGAIFCGQAAKTLCNIPPCKHRVVNYNKKRLSIWYEIGVKSQIPTKNIIKKISHISQPNIKPKLSQYEVYIEDIKENLVLNLGETQNLTIFDLKKGIENSKFGLPTSKIMSSTEKIFYDIKKKMLLEKYNDDKLLNSCKEWTLTSNGILKPKI